MLSLLAALPFSVLVLADLLVAAWPEAVGGGEAVPLADDFAGVGVDDRGRARGGVTVDEVRRQVHQPCLALRGIDEKLGLRSEEHTSELQSLMRISHAVFCLKKKKYTKPK